MPYQKDMNQNPNLSKIFRLSNSSNENNKIRTTTDEFHQDTTIIIKRILIKTNWILEDKELINTLQKFINY